MCFRPRRPVLHGISPGRCWSPRLSSVGGGTGAGPGGPMASVRSLSPTCRSNPRLGATSGHLLREATHSAGSAKNLLLPVTSRVGLGPETRAEATSSLPWLTQRKRPESKSLTPVLSWAKCGTLRAGTEKGHSWAGRPLSRAPFPPDTGFYLTSKLIGGTMPGSQMRKQRVGEARGLFQGHTDVMQPNPEGPWAWPPTPSRLARPETGVWELLESRLVMPLTPLDLNNIHSTNIYPRHQRAREAPPLAQVPAD